MLAELAQKDVSAQSKALTFLTETVHLLCGMRGEKRGEERVLPLHEGSEGGERGRLDPYTEGSGYKY